MAKKRIFPTVVLVLGTVCALAGAVLGVAILEGGHSDGPLPALIGLVVMVPLAPTATISGIVASIVCRGTRTRAVIGLCLALFGAIIFVASLLTLSPRDFVVV